MVLEDGFQRHSPPVEIDGAASMAKPEYDVQTVLAQVVLKLVWSQFALAKS